MNSKWLRVGILALTVSCCAYGQDVNAIRTGGLFNGRFWNAASVEGRLGYLMGFNDALGARGSDGSAARYLPTLNFAEQQTAVTRFYQEPENLAIPILGALEVITLKVKGGDQSAIDALLARHRKTSNEVNSQVKPEQ